MRTIEMDGNKKYNDWHKICRESTIFQKLTAKQLQAYVKTGRGLEIP